MHPPQADVDEKPADVKFQRAGSIGAIFGGHPFVGDKKGSQDGCTIPTTITMLIGTMNVHRVFLDNGISANILYYSTYKKLGFPDNDINFEDANVYSFTGEAVRVMGSIRLPVILGEGTLSVSQMIDFKVLDQDSVHNVLVGRPWLRAFRVITSIHHLMIKFSTPNGVGSLRGSQYFDFNLDPRIPMPAEKTGPPEDTISIPIDKYDLSKVLKVGSQLSYEIRESLTHFLINNLDIFAWSHSDMVEIDPRVMCHHLNVFSNCTGIRQKRRMVSGERAIALK
ncbi:uncharacterized protein LOC141686197 [Apium graveolens]|uniref:uncharacterized protein LOC141686197 n=1 Tax=Apium graveolens TaxID=4045 RepID=UPI003D79ADEF